MNRIYHGYFTKNADGTNKIILAGERCFCQTLRPFWKFPEDILDLGVKTRTQIKKEAAVCNKRNLRSILR